MRNDSDMVGRNDEREKGGGVSPPQTLLRSSGSSLPWGILSLGMREKQMEQDPSSGPQILHISGLCRYSNIFKQRF